MPARTYSDSTLIRRPFGELLQDVGRRPPDAALDLGEVRVRHAGDVGELAHRHPGELALRADERPEVDEPVVAFVVVDRAVDSP